MSRNVSCIESLAFRVLITAVNDVVTNVANIDATKSEGRVLVQSVTVIVELGTRLRVVRFALVFSFMRSPALA